jgi:methyltransferase
MLVEGAMRSASPGWVAMGGAAVFLAAKALKWWAIVTLGTAWTFRVITVPGAPLVSGGPYRVFRHPNYIGVVGELAGVALMTGAALTGPIATIAFCLLMLKRIGIEERAIGGS